MTGGQVVLGTTDQVVGVEIAAEIAAEVVAFQPAWVVPRESAS